MAVAFRAISETQGGTGAVVAKPTGTVAGDLMIWAHGNCTYANPMQALPAGWKYLSFNLSGSTVNANSGVFAYKVAGPSEPSSYTFPVYTRAWGGSQAGALMSIASYSGVNPDNPFLAQTYYTTTGSFSNSSSLALSQIADRTTATLVVAMVGYGFDSSGSSFTALSSVTGTGATLRSTTTGVNVGFADQAWTPSSGSSPGIQFNYSTPPPGQNVTLVALNPDVTPKVTSAGSGAGAAVFSSASTTSDTVLSLTSLPTETAPGNTFVAMLTLGSGGGWNGTLPTGWQVIPGGSSNAYGAMFARRCDFTDTAAYNYGISTSRVWAWNTAGSAMLANYRYLGAGSDVNFPVDRCASSLYGPYTTSPYPAGWSGQTIIGSDLGLLLTSSATCISTSSPTTPTPTYDAALTQRYSSSSAVGSNYFLTAFEEKFPYTTAGTSPSYTHSFTSSGNWEVNDFVSVFTGPNASPNAPTLTAPDAASYLDLTGTPTFSWTFSDPNASDAQSAWAMRRKIAGASTYEYWNVSTSAWQSTEVFNTSTSTSYTFPSAKWSNNTTYNWSVSTRDNASIPLTGPYATDRTLTGSTPPTVTCTQPASTITDTARPIIAWTYSDVEGSPQVQYEVSVYAQSTTTAPGFTVGQSTGRLVYSALLSGAATSYLPFNDLPNLGTYVAYVRAYQTGNQYGQASITYTISLATPAAPTVLASVNSTTGEVSLDVHGHDNILTANQSSLETDTTGWAAGSNTSIARVTTQHNSGVASLSLTSTAAGDISATTPTGTSGFPVAPSSPYTALAAFKSAVSARSARIAISWYTATGSLIGTSISASNTTSASAWNQALITDTSPSNAAFASISSSILATAAGSEVHYVDTISLAPGTTTAWSRGGFVNNVLTIAIIERSLDGGTSWTTIQNNLGGDNTTQIYSWSDNAPVQANIQYRAKIGWFAT